MIIQETITINNHQFKHTFSSLNKYIQQVETGGLYKDAYDTLKSNYHYIETDKDVEIEQVHANEMNQQLEQERED